MLQADVQQQTACSCAHAQVAMRDLLSLWMQANVQQGANGPLNALLQGLPSYSLGLSRQPPQQQVRPIPPVVCFEHVCSAQQLGEAGHASVYSSMISCGNS